MEHLTGEKIYCFHCGEECPGDEILSGDKYFCCTGCRSVYEILNENNLCDYYKYEKSPGRKPHVNQSRFDYLDDPLTSSKILTFQNDITGYVTFGIPNIHCTSCIWILENLYRLCAGIFHSEVDFLNKTVTIKFHKNEISLKEIVIKLASIGYEPLIHLDAFEKKEPDQENRKILYKLGVAGFCFGNIMLLSFPEYLSINISEVFYRKLFSYLNLLLSLPVLFYSASYYFESAIKSLREKIININLPLSLGILVLFFRSCWEILTFSGAGYCDSLAGLVFLLLTGRYVQLRTYSSLNFERDYKSYFPLSVIRRTGNIEISIPVSELKKGDRITIRNNEIIPGDSILFSESAYIDYSFITGESDPLEVKEGGLVYAGGKLSGHSVELEIVREVSQSYLTRLWDNSVFKKEERSFSHFTNKLSRHFTAAILLIAIISSFIWLPDWYSAMNVFTAVLIVACPCAIALSVPFTYGNAMRILGKNKLYLRNSLGTEDLSHIDTIVIDKTGTITRTEDSNVTYYGKEISFQEQSYIKTLAGSSIHPLSRKIYKYLGNVSVLKPDFYNEKEGSGIRGEFDGIQVRLGSRNFTAEYLNDEESLINRTHVHLSINNEYMGYFQFTNSYREGVFDTISSLKNMYPVYLLSGDNDGEKNFLLDYFEGDKILFNQSPQNKLEFIEKLQSKGRKVLMIGDGLNNAGALKQSDFGLAVTDNISNFSPACNAIIDSDSLNKIFNFLKFSSDSSKIVYLNFIISLIYNVAGLSFAVNGLLTPLIAAILMPLSSITVVAVAAAGTFIAAGRRKLCQ